MQGIASFVGDGDTIEEAVAVATRKANQWLEAHQWRANDGRSAYTTTLYAGYILGMAGCIIMLTGPLEEAPSSIRG